MARRAVVTHNQIHEYDDDSGRRIWSASAMRYPQAHGFPKYGVGDIIFHRRMRKRWAAHEFREFRRYLDNEATVSSFICSYLEMDWLEVAERIESIRLVNGRPYVVTQPIVLIAQGEAVEVTPRTSGPRRYRDDRFKQHYIETRHADAGAVFVTTGRWLMVAATLPFGGAMRGVVSNMLGRVVRRGGVRAMRSILRRSSSRFAARIAIRIGAWILRFMRDVILDVTKDVMSEMRQNSNRNAIRSDLGRASVPFDTARIVRNAVAKAVSGNLVGSIVNELNSLVPEVRPVEFMPADFEERIRRAVMTSIPAILFRDLDNRVHASILAAYTSNDNSSASYEVRLKRELQRRIEETSFRNTVVGHLRSAVEDAASNAFSL